MADKDDILQVDVLDEQHQLTLQELTELCQVQSSLIMDLVEEGALEPIDMYASQWYFSGTTIRRVQIAVRLHRDLNVNMPGIALALELLEELEQFRRR